MLTCVNTIWILIPLRNNQTFNCSISIVRVEDMNIAMFGMTVIAEPLGNAREYPLPLLRCYSEPLEVVGL
jgi:hypothetical protein